MMRPRFQMSNVSVCITLTAEAQGHIDNYNMYIYTYMLCMEGARRLNIATVSFRTMINIGTRNRAAFIPTR